MGSGGSLPAIATRSSNPHLSGSVINGWCLFLKCAAWMISVHGVLLREKLASEFSWAIRTS